MQLFVTQSEPLCMPNPLSMDACACGDLLMPRSRHDLQSQTKCDGRWDQKHRGGHGRGMRPSRLMASRGYCSIRRCSMLDTMGVRVLKPRWGLQLRARKGHEDR
jgi:hypothetical protein